MHNFMLLSCLSQNEGLKKKAMSWGPEVVNFDFILFILIKLIFDKMGQVAFTFMSS